jgi:hypothetical protein
MGVGYIIIVVVSLNEYFPFHHLKKIWIKEETSALWAWSVILEMILDKSRLPNAHSKKEGKMNNTRRKF